MFKFLFGGRGETAVIETKRQSFERLVMELNTAIDELADKPKVTFDPVTGHVTFELPEQMPDEALALPAPKAEEPAIDTTSQDETDADVSSEVSEETPKKVA